MKAPYKRDEVLGEYTVPGTYTLELKTSGVYLVEAISGGAAGTQWDWYEYWGTSRQFGIKRGATGAYFKGLVRLSKGSHTIIVANINGGSTSIDNGFIMSGGENSTPGNEGTHPGGSITSSSYIVSDDSNIYNAGYTSYYHYVYQVNPSGNILPAISAPVPENLSSYGFGGAGGFYPATNNGGSGYFKISYKGR